MVIKDMSNLLPSSGSLSSF